jgi:hypothetical protein
MLINIRFDLWALKVLAKELKDLELNDLLSAKYILPRL